MEAANWNLKCRKVLILGSKGVPYAAVAIKQFCFLRDLHLKTCASEHNCSLFGYGHLNEIITNFLLISQFFPICQASHQ